MDFYDVLFAKKLNGEGGGSSVDVEALSVTANGTYTAEEGKAYSPVTVNVSANYDPLIDGTISGELTTNVTSIRAYAFYNCASLTNIKAPSCTSIKTYALYGCNGLTQLVFPLVKTLDANAIRGCANLVAVDMFGQDVGGAKAIGSNTFLDNPKMNVLVIRNTSAVASLGNISAFSNTCFASGKTGGTLYVPNSLKASYQSATNWSTILGYANNNIESIEGSAYENAYVDGTPIGG